MIRDKDIIYIRGEDKQRQKTKQIKNKTRTHNNILTHNLQEIKTVVG